MSNAILGVDRNGHQLSELDTEFNQIRVANGFEPKWRSVGTVFSGVENLATPGTQPGLNSAHEYVLASERAMVADKTVDDLEELLNRG